MGQPICQPHWLKLVEAMKARELGHLLGKTSEERIRAMVDDAEQGLSEFELLGDRARFDPLVAAANNIDIWAVESGQRRSLDEDVSFCPICESERKGTPAGQWIEDVANGVLGEAQSLGLLRQVFS